MNRAASTLAAAFLLSGCGYIGAPLAPSLDIPSRVNDLRAVERGENLVVAFTLPDLTTQGLALKSVRSVELRVTPASGSPSLFEVPMTGPGAGGRTVPARAWIGQDVVLAVRATGPKGKTSDWSADLRLHVEPPLQTPTALKPQNLQQGVEIVWSGASPHYRVFRATGDEKPAQIAESDGPAYVDTTTQFGTKYQYWIQGVAGDLQQSDVAGPVEIVPKHEFPPAVPAGLSAVAGTNTIELAWERNTEPDFKGYNVYRSVAGGSRSKIADLIPAPTYSDRQVESGKTYSYTVSAVDLSGLESQPSKAEEATAP